MKKITLIRHAKSSWENPGLRDHDRPLNKRGERDAPFMGKLMASKGWRPDVLISSTATRAHLTALAFVEALGGEQTAPLMLDHNLYEASVPSLLYMIANLDNKYNEVALFGHNPTLTMLTNMYYQNAYLDNLSTCGVVEVEAEVNEWTHFSPETATVKAIHYPKQYFKKNKE